jgi:hypothetical protein
MGRVTAFQILPSRIVDPSYHTEWNWIQQDLPTVGKGKGRLGYKGLH